MRASSQREKVHFKSGDAVCAAWHYQGSNGACVVMAPGLAVPKEPATDPFARPFNEAGFSVLAFDFRRFAEGAGEPRQVFDVDVQLTDMLAALDYAQSLPEVDAARVAAWGFSMGGGHLFPLAARRPDLACAIAVSPFTDGQAASRKAMPYQAPRTLARLTARALADSVGSRLGRPARLVPLTGERGTLAMSSVPDAFNAERALNPEGRHPDWRQEIAARSLLAIGRYRPGRKAPQVRCPLLVLACEEDEAVGAAGAIRAGELAPLGEVVRMPGGHYEPYMDGYERALEAQLEFLRRCLLGERRPSGLPLAAASAG